MSIFLINHYLSKYNARLGFSPVIMSGKASRTIRWDDPAYSAKSSEDSSSAMNSLSNSSIGAMPAGNLAIKNVPVTAHSNVVTSTSWRELKTRDGRAYYYNSVTQKTVWEMPQEYQEYLEFTQNSKIRRPSGSENEGDSMFWEILKERRVTSKWTWEEALRAIITHPNYKCIPTLQERKASFQRYCEAMRVVEEEEARLQSLAIKEAFKALLASDPQITSDTKWSQVVDKHGRVEAFVAVPSSRERVQLFEEYQSELRRSELENVWAKRKAATNQIQELLKNMNISLDLKRGKFPDWFEIKDKLIGTIPDVDPVEYFLTFEEHCHELLKEFQASRRAEKQAELLKELEYREAFIGLLKELKESEEITPFSTWTSIYPLFKDRSEYKNLISIYLYGSSPIDLFYDLLDKIQETYENDRSKISEYFKTEFMTTESIKLPKQFTSFTQFKETIKTALGLEGVHVKFAFIQLYGPDAMISDRNRINAYKHLLKHLNPPIRMSETWDEVKTRLKGKEEYENVFSEEDREIYFLKFKKWLSKHEDVNEKSEKSDYRDRERSDRDHRDHRDPRDRDHRDYRDSKKSRWDDRKDHSRERSRDYSHETGRDKSRNDRW